jgi:hypothetical protein
VALSAKVSLFWCGKDTGQIVNLARFLNDAVTVAVYNYYSLNDTIFKYLYAAVQAGRQPAGLRRLRSSQTLRTATYLGSRSRILIVSTPFYLAAPAD